MSASLQVATRGQFAVRGGIVDLYSWQAPLPVRLEFFGDEIDSLREFDIDTQTSLRDLTSVDILLGATEDKSGIVRDYVGRDHLVSRHRTGYGARKLLRRRDPQELGRSSTFGSAKAGLRSGRGRF